MAKFKSSLLNDALIYSILSIILGILLCFVNGEVLSSFIFILIGIMIIIYNINNMIRAIKNLKFKTKVAYIQFGEELLKMLVAIGLIFFQGTLSWVVAIFLLAIVIVPPLLLKYSLTESLKNNIVIIIFSICLLLFGFGGIADIVLKIFGILMIIYGVGDLLLVLRSK